MISGNKNEVFEHCYACVERFVKSWCKKEQQNERTRESLKVFPLKGEGIPDMVKGIANLADHTRGFRLYNADASHTTNQFSYDKKKSKVELSLQDTLVLYFGTETEEDWDPVLVFSVESDLGFVAARTPERAEEFLNEMLNLED